MKKKNLFVYSKIHDKVGSTNLTYKKNIKKNINFIHKNKKN